MLFLLAISTIVYFFYRKKVRVLSTISGINIQTDSNLIEIEHRNWKFLNYYNNSKDKIIIEENLIKQKNLWNTQNILILQSIRDNYLSSKNKLPYKLYKYILLYQNNSHYPIFLAILLFLLNGQEIGLAIIFASQIICCIILFFIKKYINNIINLSKEKVEHHVESENLPILIKTIENLKLYLFLSFLTSYGRSIHMAFLLLRYD